MPEQILFLVHVLLILANIIAIDKAMQPPHPPPSKEEAAPSTKLEGVMKHRAAPKFVRITSWLVILAEVAVLFALQNPRLLFARHILSALVFNSGSVENIHMSGMFLTGTIMILIGTYIRWSCYRALGRLFTFEMTIRKDHQLVTDGPYGIVRHPAYTGFFLAVIGIGLWQGSPGSWGRECGFFNSTGGILLVLSYGALILTVSVGMIFRMPMEDAALKKTFGEKWDAWKDRVPYMLIPWVY